MCILTRVRWHYDFKLNSSNGIVRLQGATWKTLFTRMACALKRPPWPRPCLKVTASSRPSPYQGSLSNICYITRSWRMEFYWNVISKCKNIQYKWKYVINKLSILQKEMMQKVVTWAIPKIKFNRYRRIYRLLSCIVFLFIK